MKNKHQTYLEIARLFANNSTCCSRKTGCCIVKDGRVISTGYNGVPSGQEHCEQHWYVGGREFTREKHHEWSKENELHAESNALMACCKNGIATKGSAMYMIISPCANCALLIVQAGITHVYYETEYDLSNGLEILKKNNVRCIKI